MSDEDSTLFVAEQAVLSAIPRFMDKVRFSPNCWEWTAGGDVNGYGRFWWNGQMILPHRLAFEVANGVVLPPEIKVCHSCDNPPCVRPSHMFTGSQADNLADMARKGRGSNQFAGVTECIHGHPFTPENTYTYEREDKGASRHCRTCTATRMRSRRARGLSRG